MSDADRNYWREGHRPHRVVGGRMDGRIVSYFGGPAIPGQGFEYGFPYVLSFAPMYVEADRMEPVSVEVANREHRAFLERLKAARVGTDPDLVELIPGSANP